METPAAQTPPLKRQVLEMELSGVLCGKLDEILDFSLRSGIRSFVLYGGEEAFPEEKELFEQFFRRAEKAGISCTAALPCARHDLLETFRKEKKKLLIRIGTEAQKNAFLKEKEAFPGAELEFFYEKEEIWDLDRAMVFCREQEIPCSFGCSEAFVSASIEDLEKFCAPDEKGIPFPGGTPCMRFVRSLFLDKEGNLFPCRGMKNLPAGNILHKEISELVENSTVLKFYQEYTKKIKNPCRSGPSFGYCAGCRGRAHAYGGDFLSADPACFRNRDKREKIAVLPAKDPENYMPHKKPMLMISELTRIQDNVCEGASVIGKDNPFLAGSVLDPAALIEIGAQSMAFLDSFLHPGGSLQGMLVEISRFEYTGRVISCGDRLKIRGEKVYEMPPWNIGEFRICADDGEEIASGEVKICQMPEES